MAKLRDVNRKATAAVSRAPDQSRRSKSPERTGAKYRSQRHSPSLRLLRRNLDLCITDPHKILFLDIETTGLSHHYDDITLIGWALNGEVGNVIGGQDIFPFETAIGNASVLVTFNGTRFDKKFIKRDHPHITLPESHIDLMYLCRRIGLTGGQKSIEKKLGIQFRDDIEHLDGAQAVILWHRYIRGDLDALRELIAYNRADIAAMGAILNVAYARINAQLNLFHTRAEFHQWSAPKGSRKAGADIALPNPQKWRRFTYSDFFDPRRLADYQIVGIDLTGSEERPSGWCVLRGCTAKTEKVFSDAEIVAKTLDANPVLVSIDSPLCLPAGRISAGDDDPGREKFGIMRECERELKRRGINVYPCLIPSMQNMTVRGIRLADVLRRRGIPVIESYPGAAQDIMRVPRKGAGVQWLNRGLTEFGISSVRRMQDLSHDELDAITAALVGTFHLATMTEALGTTDEPPLIIPATERQNIPLVIGISGPIAAGKTTTARAFEQRGFAYARFSQVIDEMLAAQQTAANRFTRQRLGAAINAEGKQRWLCEQTIARVAGAKEIVIDGLRFPDDHAFLVESFGLRFIHLHITAMEDARKARYEDQIGDSAFDRANAAPVEAKVQHLAEFAHRVFSNDGGLRRLWNWVDRVITDARTMSRT